MSSAFIGNNQLIDDTTVGHNEWNFELPMFTLINPNEILSPLEILTVNQQHQLHHQQHHHHHHRQQQQQYQQPVDCVTDITNQFNNYQLSTYTFNVNNSHLHNQIQVSTQPLYEQQQNDNIFNTTTTTTSTSTTTNTTALSSVEDDLMQFKQQSQQHQNILTQPLHIINTSNQYRASQYMQHSHQTEHIEPPPTLLSYDEPKLQLQQKLELHRVMSQQRRDRIKARLDREPPQLQIIRKGGNRKLTGRERLIELEREEERLLRMRNHYLESINKLEQKCNKLRSILGNIVTTSPEYNATMIQFLETNELLYDKNESSSLVSGENSNRRLMNMDDKQRAPYGAGKGRGMANTTNVKSAS